MTGSNFDYKFLEGEQYQVIFPHITLQEQQLWWEILNEECITE
jgi:hypothetical protein